MKRAERLGEVIARRQLTLEGTDKRVTVLLGKPFQVATDSETVVMFGKIADVSKGDWICPFKMTGLRGVEPSNPSKGVFAPLPASFFYNEIDGKDSLEALTNALMVLDSIQIRFHPRLHWKYSFGLNDGFPIMLQYYSLTNKPALKEKFLKEITDCMQDPANHRRSPYWREWISCLYAAEKPTGEDETPPDH